MARADASIGEILKEGWRHMDGDSNMSDDQRTRAVDAAQTQHRRQGVDLATVNYASAFRGDRSRSE